MQALPKVGSQRSQVGGMIMLALLDILKSEALAWKDTRSLADWGKG